MSDTRVAMEACNLAYAYGSNKVLKDISVQIHEGKITTLMGGNGCGKSTLFALMTRNLSQQKGRVLLGGKDIRAYSLSEFARLVSIVHQNNSASDDITVERLVSYGRTPYRRMFGGLTGEDRKYIEHAIRITHLEDYRNREVSKLSGGQRQRVWIAMALAQNTGILFLDEPTTYLDIRYQLDILRLVRSLNEEYGITIIMVLHDINQAIHFSHRCIGIKDGRIIMDGEPEKVVTEDIIEKLYSVHLDVRSVEEKKFVLMV